MSDSPKPSSYLNIPEPCTEDWSKMTPNEQGAFCDKCSKNVHDLNGVTDREIMQLFHDEVNLCVRVSNKRQDEFNLNLWWSQLNLVKRIRYLFAFSLLFVFQFNGFAQAEEEKKYLDSANQVSLVDSLEFPDSIVWIDSTVYNMDWEWGYFNFDSIQPLNQYLESGGTVPILVIDETSLELNDEPDEYTVNVIDEMGASAISYPPEELNINISDPAEMVFVSGGMTLGGWSFEAPLEYPLNIPISNEIELDENFYSFTIEDDVLRFGVTANKATKIQIKITKSFPPAVAAVANDVVLDKELFIDEGYHSQLIPINGFLKGEYIITIIDRDEVENIRTMYF